MGCIFCGMVAGEIPCHKVWEDETHMAFLSIFPNTKGFTVVIPKHHCGSYAFEQSDEVLTQLILATKKVANVLDRAFDDVGRTGMFFEGYGVDHLHSKLFPMHGTGNDASFKLIESKSTKYFEHYEGYLSSHDCNRADDAELSELARYIRSFQKVNE
ncbi:HIT family protein [Photobacterium kishitanii]|uniref:HIT family protein n=1 Tax=Photobacterium kishitanii TaxID=318456 RepID=UPI000D175854|nr:HIT family protein [Photobacterium kishitanii]PSU20861.1 diadenosine tetraphosphate hydrolase [Photobacterium kishitanii]